MKSLNGRAWNACQQLQQRADVLRVQRDAEAESGLGCQLWDFGNQVAGGLEAGLTLAKICMSDLASVCLVPMSETQAPETGWGVQVLTDHPYAACIESQYAGWKLQRDRYFAMGSGPMRVASVCEPMFAHRDREVTDVAVGVLEAASFPPSELVRQIAADCQVSVDRLCLLAARTASLAGTVQVVARSVETTLHKLLDLQFDLQTVVSGSGVAPLPPVAKDDLLAIGWTNDAILYGAEVSLWIRGVDDDLAQIVDKIPSNGSRDYGEPFATIFSRYDHDFYKIDPHLFSPARVRLINLNTGRCFAAGQTNAEVLRASFAAKRSV